MRILQKLSILKKQYNYVFAKNYDKLGCPFNLRRQVTIIPTPNMDQTDVAQALLSLSRGAAATAQH